MTHTKPMTALTRRITGALAAAAMLGTLLILSVPAIAQSLTPPSITITGGAVCTGGSQTIPVSITLPTASVVDKVDVFFLFDDTGSFAGFVPTVTSIFSGLVTSLETSLPAVSFGFGVGRFEDYGGPGSGFSSESTTGRPFTLNQPIVTAATAGGAANRNTLISSALGRTAPGFGGDGPESGLEALYQVATGLGFDGDGNGSSLDSGPAGSLSAQTSPGTSGDVPSFSSNTSLTSGVGGGVGWRPDALHLVILATDICSVTAFPAGSAIPGLIAGAGASIEPVSAFACASLTPGSSRFGFVSNSKGLAGNSVAGAVAPSGAGGLVAAVNALNALGVRVIGMGPGAAPTASTSPTSAPSTWLSALARLTGALSTTGTPLVFSTSVPLATLSTQIADAITTTATRPVDLTLSNTSLPTGLLFGFAPTVVSAVPPGGTASFSTTLTGNGTPVSGSFDINFLDFGSHALLGKVPVSVSCAVKLTCDVDGDADVDVADLVAIRAGNGQAAAADDPRNANGDGVINAADARFCTLRCTRAGCAQ